MTQPLNAEVANARSFLFVPGNRPERFEKALRSGADAVVLDLEDAVPLGAKRGARDAIGQAWPALRLLGIPLIVRINPVDQALGQDDLRWIGWLEGLAAVMVPKVESAEGLAVVRTGLPAVPILPLIESVGGHAALDAIAGAPGVLRLVVGHIDFMVDSGIQCGDDQSELAPLRFAVAMSTRIHKLAAAIDGVTAEVDDEERLRIDTRRALRYGFGAKLCIHPRQISAVHECLAPSVADLAWARRVVEADAAAKGAAVQLDGRMVDLPVVRQARRTLARADR
ncbi:CoA ester lyase [Variovorax sp. J22P168]|uniref:HpcH/HpaI aldolase/citrate lyase family protein n=1 Tax=Variovorax jilinensis TaxID=3053513 RepID=UPI002576B5C4|nr:CoA ester lyase [Variovorax sp. J22P168]MDM0012126.1 CoA ester lyase [Variovorax sp. J22P168]